MMMKKLHWILLCLVCALLFTVPAQAATSGQLTIQRSQDKSKGITERRFVNDAGQTEVATDLGYAVERYTYKKGRLI